VAGTISLAFFSSALRMDEAVAQFVQPLKEAALCISSDLAPELAAAE
jgi:hypothetical protein